LVSFCWLQAATDEKGSKAHQPVAGCTLGAATVDAPEEKVAVGDIALAVAPPLLHGGTPPAITNESNSSIPQS